MQTYTVPFAGRMSYCLMKSLQMVLEHRGDFYPLPFLECASTEPFGFVYVRGANGGFAVNGYEYDLAGERLLQLLGYEYEVLCDDAPEPALARLRTRVAREPVVVGMLDMGFLTYQPDREYKRGSDHAIVILAVEDDGVLVHDPDGYVSTPLPLGDFLQAWRADGLYTRKHYMQWRIGERVRRPPPEEIYRRALELGLDNMRRVEEISAGETTVMHGAKALRALAADLREQRTGPWLRRYAHFSFRVSGQRCFDSARFLREAPFANAMLEAAAESRLQQARRYGEAQLAAVKGEPDEVARSLERIATLEEETAAALERGLQSGHHEARALR